ncbi:MAG: arylesterase [Proteobacteria bacterium]|nr:arylesterase [Pseudomonadota bacterium]
MWFKSFLFVAIFMAFASVVFGLAPPVAAAQTGEPVIVAMGDSLMAGYNLPADAAFPAQLEARLRADGIGATVINAGVSGDTSAGGLARLDWALASANGGNPDLVILEFGGNGALRGIDPAVTRGNLDEMLSILRGRNINVLLVGMRAPPNMGREFAEEFDAIFPDLAANYGVALYPFFLKGVVLQPELKLKDGIHPNREGVAIMVDGMAPMVAKLLAN